MRRQGTSCRWAKAPPTPGGNVEPPGGQGTRHRPLPAAPSAPQARSASGDRHCSTRCCRPQRFRSVPAFSRPGAGADGLGPGDPPPVGATLVRPATPLVRQLAWLEPARPARAPPDEPQPVPEVLDGPLPVLGGTASRAAGTAAGTAAGRQGGYQRAADPPGGVIQRADRDSAGCRSRSSPGQGPGQARARPGARRGRWPACRPHAAASPGSARGRAPRGAAPGSATDAGSCSQGEPGSSAAASSVGRGGDPDPRPGDERRPRWVVARSPAMSGGRRRGPVAERPAEEPGPDDPPGRPGRGTERAAPRGHPAPRGGTSTGSGRVAVLIRGCAVTTLYRLGSGSVRRYIAWLVQLRSTIQLESLDVLATRRSTCWSLDRSAG